MKTTKYKFKRLAVAVGLGLALASGSASALLTGGNNFLEDDVLDFFLDENANGLIDVGEALGGVFEVNFINGDLVGPDGRELTGVFGLEVATKTATANPTEFDFTFRPIQGGLNSFLANGTLGAAVADGDPGEGAVIAFWLEEGSADLNISASLLPGPLSCASLAQCIDQATNINSDPETGDPWQVDGYVDYDEVADGDNGDGDNFVEVLGAPDLAAGVLLVNPAQEVGSLAAGLSVLENNTGALLELDMIACLPNCGTGPGPTNGFVDFLLGGSLKGGLGLDASLVADGAFATGDVDAVKRAIPEPTSLALLAAGLLGFGVAQGRSRKA